MQRSPNDRGPFTADQLRDGDRYELDQGHPVYCAPTGARGGKANLFGAEALDTDPLVEAAGIDVGYSPEPGTLRAPDIAIGNVPNEPGWVKGAPALAVEYADTGQDETDLARKIRDLLAAGTKHVWVVRLVGVRRVEVHERGAPVRVLDEGAVLTAPSILKNAVPVRAFFDRAAAHRLTFQNLLEREGYANLDEVREEGREEARARAIVEVLDARGLSLDDATRARILACRDPALVSRWLHRAATVATAADVTREPA